MADAFELAISLPPFLYNGSQTEKLQPVVSATYTPEDYKRNVNNSLHLHHFEMINRAAQSGRKADLDRAVEMVHDEINAYHAKNQMAFAPQEPVKVVGMNPDLKTATMKHRAKTQEE